MKWIWYAALVGAMKLSAQPSAIMVTSETGDIFRVSINNQPPPDCFSERVYLDDFSPGLYRVAAEVYLGPRQIATVFQDVNLPMRTEADVRLGRDNFGRFTMFVTMRPRDGMPSTTPGLPRPGGPVVQPPPAVPAQPNPMPGYNGPVGCPTPASPDAVADAFAAIRNVAFRDEKLMVAKQFLSSNCVFARDVLEMMRLFSFDDDRLEVAKFAYPATYDQGNYFIVNDGFAFSSTRAELHRFISR